MPKKYPKGMEPPCPGRHGQYVLVNRGGYYYWRLKRGTIKPAGINMALRQRCNALKALTPLMKELKITLVPLMFPIPAGQLHNALFKWLQQSWISKGRANYADLRGQELHSKYRLHKVLQAPYFCRLQEDMIRVNIGNCPYALKPQNRLVTDFVLEAVLVWGDERGFETHMQTSSLYNIATGIDRECLFEWPVPRYKPWMVLLKLACFEENSNAHHPMHYGMRIIETGGH